MTKSLQEYMKRIQFFTNMSTWVYENRVGKQFVISLNFCCLSFFTMLFSWVDFFFFGCSVIRDLCRNDCRGNLANSVFFDSPPPSLPKGCFFIPTQNSLKGAVTYCPASDKGFDRPLNVFFFVVVSNAK